MNEHSRDLVRGGPFDLDVERHRIDVTVGGVHITAAGVRRFDARTTYEQVLDVARVGSAHINVGKWVVGDCVNFVERRKANAQDDWSYEQLAAETGRSIGGLWNIASVCGRVPYDVRRPWIAWGVHEAIAKLDRDEQIAMLDRVEEEHLTVEQVRALTRDPDDLTRSLGTTTVRLSGEDMRALEVVRELRAEFGERLTPELVRQGAERRVREIERETGDSGRAPSKKPAGKLLDEIPGVELPQRYEIGSSVERGQIAEEQVGLLSDGLSVANRACDVLAKLDHAKLAAVCPPEQLRIWSRVTAAVANTMVHLERQLRADERVARDRVSLDESSSDSLFDTPTSSNAPEWA